MSDYYKPEHEMTSKESNMANQEFFIEDQDWAKKLESDFEDYIWSCESLVDFDPESDEEEFQTLSGEPFCGCQTCFTREQLFFLIPKILKAYKAGQITLNEE